MTILFDVGRYGGLVFWLMKLGEKVALATWIVSSHGGNFELLNRRCLTSKISGCASFKVCLITDVCSTIWLIDKVELTFLVWFVPSVDMLTFVIWLNSSLNGTHQFFWYDHTEIWFSLVTKVAHFMDNVSVHGSNRVFTFIFFNNKNVWLGLDYRVVSCYRGIRCSLVKCQLLWLPAKYLNFRLVC